VALGYGQRSYAAPGTITYTFELPGEDYVGRDSRISVEVAGQVSDGSIISCSGSHLVLALDTEIGETIAAAVLLVDSTGFLLALKERIEELERGHAWFNRALADRAIEAHCAQPIANPVEHRDLKNLNRYQFRAYHHAMTHDITRIWGPPGTGKTQTIAAIVQSIVESGRRVLVCSNTHKAVDQVLLRYCSSLGKEHPILTDGQLVRLGEIADPKFHSEYASFVTFESARERSVAQPRALQERLRVERGELEKGLAAREVREADVLRLRAQEARAVLLAQNISAARERMQAIEATLGERARRRKKLLRKLDDAASWWKVWCWRPERTRRELTNLENTTSALRDELSVLARLREADEADAAQVSSEIEVLGRSVGSDTIESLAAESRAARQAVAAVSGELDRLEAEISQREDSLIRSARIIGCTCAMAGARFERLGPFDVVIIDEVSMILPPAVWFCAGLAKSQVVMCGDSRQLPPIVETDAEIIFDLLGTDVLRRFEWAPSTLMLTEQHRMVEPICELINGPMYRSRLVTARGPTLLPHPIAPFDEVLTIVDSSDLYPLLEMNQAHSHYNIIHAQLIRSILWHIERAGGLPTPKSLSVCTPYVAQANLIRQALTGLGRSDRVAVGTVHTFQGDETSALIFEVPDSPGADVGLGVFGDDAPPDSQAARLLNVAISRAREQLIMVVNLKHLDEHLAANSLLRSVLHVMQSRGRVIAGRDVLRLGPIDSDLRGLIGHVALSDTAQQFGIFDENDFSSAFAADIAAAERSIVLVSGFITKARADTYRELLRPKIAAGVKVRCITRPPHSNGSIPFVEGDAGITVLRDIGCVVDLRESVHQKISVIDHAIVWNGSLNILSHNGYGDEIMMRLMNASVAEEIIVSLSKRALPRADKIATATAQENPRCEVCNNYTVFCERDGAGLFYCSRNQGPGVCADAVGQRKPPAGYVREPKEGVPRDSEGTPRCPQCKAAMVRRRGSKGDFWGCSSYPECKGSRRAGGKKSEPPMRRKPTAP
jgi:ribosomal protein L37AE/L43A